MSFSQYMDIANAVMWETIHNTNYSSHNTNKGYHPIAFHYNDIADRSPETYTYPYSDVFNPFVLIEGSSESFTSFVYKLINPETYDTTMLLTPDPAVHVSPELSPYEADQKFLSIHPALSLSSELSYGVVINETT